MSMPDAIAGAVAAYRAAFTTTWPDNAPAETVRFVVLDCETTGLDPRRDRIVSLGAVAVQEAQIVLGDTFEALLRVTHNTAATLVHGITRSEARFGMEEHDAMLALLAYLRDGVIVGHHIGHDLAMLNAACARQFDLRLANRHIDTLALTHSLEREGALGDVEHLPDASLDGLCRRFDIVPYDRHTAPGDAFLTAQVFLRLLRAARRCARDTLEGLCAATKPTTSQRDSLRIRPAEEGPASGA
jgi:DNA polymerase-3 subunit epsilon